jgi:hypothetical protein
MCSLSGNDWVSYLMIEPRIFIDINLEHLREILKVVLEDVKGLNLREDKLSVRHILRRNIQIFTDSI